MKKSLSHILLRQGRNAATTAGKVHASFDFHVCTEQKPVTDAHVGGMLLQGNFSIDMEENMRCNSVLQQLLSGMKQAESA